MSNSELQTLKRTLKLIAQIDHICDSVTEPVALLSSIVNHVADELAARICLLALIDRETKHIELKAINHRQNTPKLLQQLTAPEIAQQAVALDDLVVWEANTLLGDDRWVDYQVAAVPIILGQKTRLGALILARNKHPFSKQDIEMLKVAEDHIDSAVMQSYAAYDLQQRIKELETIYTIDHIRDRHLPFDEMLNTVLQTLCQIINAETGFVMLYDHTGQQLEMRANTDKDLLKIKANYEQLNEVAYESLRQGNLICRNNLDNQLSSIMCLPLILNGQIIGVLGVTHQENRIFKGEDKRMLSAIGSQMDTAIFESLEQRQLRDVLGRSVDPQILDRLLASNDVDFLKGERAIISVLYADIRGSTSLAEQTDPELLVGFINHYLGQMTEVVLAHEGTLDKFVGDEVMALFGAPFPQADHALRAVQTALAMQKAHQTIVEIWEDRGLPSSPIGVGIATGELIVGEMGSPQRTQYTVIGKAANLGARICSSAQGGQVLISQQTYNLIADQIEARPIHGMEYKGISGPVTVYEVISAAPLDW